MTDNTPTPTQDHEPYPWEGRTCGECTHVRISPKTKEDVMARMCFRNPPGVVGVMTQQGLLVASARPEVRVETLACGEFEEK